jgi:hypothetical protein
MPNSFLPLSVYAPFRFGKYLIMPFSFMPLSFMPISLMLLSVSAPVRLCPFPFMPLSGLMGIVDYAGLLYANFRRPFWRLPLPYPERAHFLHIKTSFGSSVTIFWG